MAIVNNFPTELNTPGAFLRVAEPQASIRGVGIGIVGVLVQTTRGPVGTPTLVSDLSDFVRKFGAWDKDLPEGFDFVRNLFVQGAGAVKVCRVTDGTEEAASVTVDGSTFELATPGTWGNKVTLTVTDSTITGYVDLTFANGSQEVYSFPQVTFVVASDERHASKVFADAGEEFVKAVTIGVANPAPGTTAFAGGTNGTATGAALTDDDYIGEDGLNGKTGLVAFEADDEVNFICTPRCTDTVNAALVDHANSDVSPRIVVIAPAKGSTVAQAKTMMATINSDKVIVTYPFLQVNNPYSKKKEYHAPTAFYAGVLATLSYQESPSRKQLNGVIGTERVLSKADVDDLGKSRISPITLLGGGFTIRNGWTAAVEPSKRNITRSRALNFFAVLLEKNSDQFVSKPHTEDLRLEVKSTLGSAIEAELDAGRIGNVNGGAAYALKCDAANNPDFIVQQNKLIVEAQISLLAPADFIFITLDASEAKAITLA